MADPTDAERGTMTDLKSVMEWAGLDVTATDDENSVAGSLMKHLGVKSNMQPRVVGIFGEADLETMQNSWRVPDAAGPTLPTLSEAGMARLFFAEPANWWQGLERPCKT